MYIKVVKTYRNAKQSLTRIAKILFYYYQFNIITLKILLIKNKPTKNIYKNYNKNNNNNNNNNSNKKNIIRIQDVPEIYNKSMLNRIIKENILK